MTDDLAKYKAEIEKLREAYESASTVHKNMHIRNAARSIHELIAMVRRATEIIEQTSDARNVFRERAEAVEAERDRIRKYLFDGECQIIESEQEWKKRADAAEKELAELKRKMREPDEPLVKELYNAYGDPSAEGLGRVWRAGVNYLLEGK